MATLPILAFVVVLLVVLATQIFKILNEYERGVIFTFGRFTGVKGPGLIILIPLVQRMVKVDLRTVVLDVPTQDVISRDNVSVKVNAVIYFRIVDPAKAIIQVANPFEATSQLAQTTLRSVLGQHELDEMLSQRDKLNVDIQHILDSATDAWGIKVANVEIKHVDLDETMIRAMAKQAEAERTRRAKIIHAEGEKQAAAQLVEAAQILGADPKALQLRYLQTLADLSSEKTTTIVFPLPIDLLRPFFDKPKIGSEPGECPLFSGFARARRSCSSSRLAETGPSVRRSCANSDSLNSSIIQRSRCCSARRGRGIGPGHERAQGRLERRHLGVELAVALDVVAQPLGAPGRGPHVLRQLLEGRLGRLTHPARRQQRFELAHDRRAPGRECRRAELAERRAGILERDEDRLGDAPDGLPSFGHASPPGIDARGELAGRARQAAFPECHDLGDGAICDLAKQPAIEAGRGDQQRELAIAGPMPRNQRRIAAASRAPRGA